MDDVFAYMLLLHHRYAYTGAYELHSASSGLVCGLLFTWIPPRRG